MAHYTARLDYPRSEIPIVLRSSYMDDTYYGVDLFESKRMKIILAKYGCRHSFHSLPGHVTANLYPFVWDRLKQHFRIRMDEKISVHLNTLEEMIVNYQVFEGK